MDSLNWQNLKKELKEKQFNNDDILTLYNNYIECLLKIVSYKESNIQYKFLYPNEILSPFFSIGKEILNNPYLQDLEKLKENLKKDGFLTPFVGYYLNNKILIFEGKHRHFLLLKERKKFPIIILPYWVVQCKINKNIRKNISNLFTYTKPCFLVFDNFKICIKNDFEAYHFLSEIFKYLMPFLYKYDIKPNKKINI